MSTYQITTQAGETFEFDANAYRTAREARAALADKVGIDIEFDSFNFDSVGGVVQAMHRGPLGMGATYSEHLDMLADFGITVTEA